MLNADTLFTKVLAQTHNKAGKAFNSTGNNLSKCFIKSQDILIFNSKLSTSGTILPIHFQALTSFFSISLYLSSSYILSRSFPAGILLINLYLLPDFLSLSWCLLIGAFLLAFFY